jgi:hypothetical protein
VPRRAGIAEGEGEDRGRDQHQSAHELKDRTCRPEQIRPRDRIGENQRHQERGDEPHGHHLQRVEMADEIFRHGVEAGEAGDRTAHQRNADQPLAALLVNGVRHGRRNYGIVIIRESGRSSNRRHRCTLMFLIIERL